MHDLPIVEATLEEEPVPEKVRLLGTISRLLSYPEDHYVQLVELLYLLVQGELPKAAKEVSQFGQFVEQQNEDALEEAYTRTFDVNPACALEVGWHLFGEDYVRGQFLVRMRSELARFEIPESAELPDHLTHVLAVIGAMDDDEAKAFVHACVFPALLKMKPALEENNSPYRHLICALILVLEDQFGPGEAWSEDEQQIPRDTKDYPGQNGPRQPGMADPLRAYPMPTEGCSGSANGVEFVPLQMQFSAPESNCNDYSDQSDVAENGRET